MSKLNADHELAHLVPPSVTARATLTLIAAIGLAGPNSASARDPAPMLLNVNVGEVGILDNDEKPLRFVRPFLTEKGPGDVLPGPLGGGSNRFYEDDGPDTGQRPRSRILDASPASNAEPGLGQKTPVFPAQSGTSRCPNDEGPGQLASMAASFCRRSPGFIAARRPVRVEVESPAGAGRRPPVRNRRSNYSGWQEGAFASAHHAMADLNRRMHAEMSGTVARG